MATEDHDLKAGRSFASRKVGWCASRLSHCSKGLLGPSPAISRLSSVRRSRCIPSADLLTDRNRTTLLIRTEHILAACMSRASDSSSTTALPLHAGLTRRATPHYGVRHGKLGRR